MDINLKKTLPSSPNLKFVHVFWTLVVMVLALYASRFYMSRIVTDALGQAIPATVSFSPELGSLPPDLPVGVTIDAKTNKLAFVRLVVLFDSTKANLTGEVYINPVFGTLISKSSMVEANSTGKIIIVAAVSSGSLPPTGIINNAVSFTLTSISENPNDQLQLSFDTNDMQLVESENITGVDIVSNPTVYVLNPVATPTPTESPSPTPTESPSPSPTASPTLSPSPSPTPSPAQDTEPPTVTITSPTNGSIVQKSSTVLIQAIANDNVSVTRVEFWVAGKRKCTDTVSPYDCSWAVGGAPNTSYVILAKAYDAQNNLGTQQITVTSSN